MLVADTSAYGRFTTVRYLGSEPDMAVVAQAADPAEVAGLVAELRPDVVSLWLDTEGDPGFGGLKRVLGLGSAVVAMAPRTPEGEAILARARGLGAADTVTRPVRSFGMHEVLAELAEKLRRAALGLGPVAALAAVNAARVVRRGPLHRLVVIGASTGGPGALREVISHLPKDLPAGVLVVQHMPLTSTQVLAESLALRSEMPVRLAAAGDVLVTGEVLVAPGGRHLTLSPEGQVRLEDGPPVNHVRPAVDVTLIAAAATHGERAVGVILTGMGYDGREGARALKLAGGYVIAQDQATSVIYGMPRSVVEAGLADKVAPLDRVPEEIRWALERSNGHRR